MEQANVEILSSSGGTLKGGAIAARLLESNFNVQALRANSVLRNREWIEFDTALIKVARQRLVGVADLFAAGLTYPIADALGVTRVEWEQVGDMGPAQVDMSGVADSPNDRVNFALNALPLPIVHKDFNINIRALHAGRRLGQPLDTTQLQLATRIVTEKVESMLFLGGPTVGSNGTVYGYTNAPQRITGTLAFDWGASATTGENMYTDISTILGAFIAKNQYGPWQLYVPNAWFIKFGDDWKANSDKSIIQRLLEIPGIAGIKPSFNLTTGVVFVQMTSDVVDMIDGMQPTVVQWESHGGMLINFKVMAIMVPRMKFDYANQSGIAYYHT